MSQRLSLNRWRELTDLPLLVVALGSMPILLLELVREDLRHSDQLIIDGVNLFVLVAFAVDLVVELSLVPDRRRYLRREWTSPLIVVCQLLAVLPGLWFFGAFRVLRSLTAINAIVRVVAFGAAGRKEHRRMLGRRALPFALSCAAVTWVASAVGFCLAEGVGTDGRVPTIGDALWWSLTTMTTVGYGDISPVTGVGRLIGGLTMIVGITTFSTLTAQIATFLVRASSDESVDNESGRNDERVDDAVSVRPVLD